MGFYFLGLGTQQDTRSGRCFRCLARWGLPGVGAGLLGFEETCLRSLSKFNLLGSLQQVKLNKAWFLEMHFHKVQSEVNRSERTKSS